MNDFDAGDVRLEDPQADLRMVSTPQLWLYLPWLLLYPLRGYALFIVIFMGALFWGASSMGLLGIAAAGILFGWMGHYSMGVVSRSANGHATPPPLGTEVLFQGEKLRLGLMVLYLITLALMGFAATRPGSPAWGLWVLLAGVYLFPAFLASLALQPDLLAAINPFSALGFVWHTGLSYLLACLALTGVVYAGFTLSGHAAGIFVSMLMIYGLLFICHLIGYVAYHRQDELQLAVAVERPTAESRATVAQAQRLGALLERVDRNLAARDPHAARDAMLAESAADVASPREFHEQLFDALRLRHQDALSLVQATRLLQLLLREKRVTRALDVYEQCLDFAKDYTPEPPLLAAQLAEQALREKRMPLFLRIAAAVQVKPTGEAAIALQFLKAQALVAESQGRRDKDAAALALVAPLMAYVSHPWAPRIGALHKALSGLTKPGA